MEQSEKQPILTLDEKMFNNNPSILIYASRRGGKSYLIRHIYTEYIRDCVDFTYVFTQSYETADFYKEFILQEDAINNPQVSVSQVPDDFLHGIEKLQNARKRSGKKPYKVMVIIDDALNNKAKYQEVLQQIFVRGRHANCGIIVATQFHTLLNPSWRNNADAIFIGKSMSDACRRYFSENYLNGQKKENYALLQQINNYWFVVVPMNHSHLHEDIYWFRVGQEESSQEQNKNCSEQTPPAIGCSKP